MRNGSPSSSEDASSSRERTMGSSLREVATRSCSSCRPSASRQTIRSRAMRDHVRTLKLVLGTAFRADPVRTLGAIFVEGIGMLGTIFVGVFLKLVTDGVLRHQRPPVVVGVIGLFVVPAVSLL